SIPGFVCSNTVHFFCNHARVGYYSCKQLFLSACLRTNPTQIVPLDELEVVSFLGWNKGRDEKGFLQHKCFGYKARPGLPGYHICSGHIGSDYFGERQHSYSLIASITG